MRLLFCILLADIYTNWHVKEFAGAVNCFAFRNSSGDIIKVIFHLESGLCFPSHYHFIFHLKVLELAVGICVGLLLKVSWHSILLESNPFSFGVDFLFVFPFLFSTFNFCVFILNTLLKNSMLWFAHNCSKEWSGTSSPSSWNWWDVVDSDIWHAIAAIIYASGFAFIMKC